MGIKHCKEIERILDAESKWMTRTELRGIMRTNMDIITEAVEYMAHQGILLQKENKYRLNRRRRK